MEELSVGRNRKFHSARSHDAIRLYVQKSRSELVDIDSLAEVNSHSTAESAVKADPVCRNICYVAFSAVSQSVSVVCIALFRESIIDIRLSRNGIRLPFCKITVSGGNTE